MIGAAKPRRDGGRLFPLFQTLWQDIVETWCHFEQGEVVTKMTMMDSITSWRQEILHAITKNRNLKWWGDVWCKPSPVSKSCMKATSTWSHVSVAKSSSSSPSLMSESAGGPLELPLQLVSSPASISLRVRKSMVMGQSLLAAHADRKSGSKCSMLSRWIRKIKHSTLQDIACVLVSLNTLTGTMKVCWVNKDGNLARWRIGLFRFIIVSFHLAPKFCLAPSIAIHSPVINFDLSETRNAISSATSSGLPTLPKLAERGWVTWMLRSRNDSYASSSMPEFFKTKPRELVNRKCECLNVPTNN